MGSHEIEFLGSFPGDVPSTGLPEVAFVGRSNVGKSSALNAILGSRVARVSNTPGRTQAVNLFRVDGRWSFADLPGYGFAKVPERVRGEWRGLVERYLSTREWLGLVVVLVDHRHAAQLLDVEMLATLRRFERPMLVLATKVDKLTRNGRAKAKPVLEAGLDAKVLPFSSETGEGVDAVWAEIERALAARRVEPPR
jgi:GTP-binding protein